MDPRQRALQMGQGAMTLNLAYVGIVDGFLELLDVALDVSELSRRSGMDAGYVLRWCDAAYAMELLDRDGDRFVLTEFGRAFQPHRPGTLMPFAIQSVLSAHMSDTAARCARTGERPGEQVLGERPLVGAWFGAMLEATFGGFFEQHVLPAVGAFSVLEADGAVACDLACGNGWYLRRLCARYPHLSGVGLDGFGPNIRQARELASRSEVGARLEFVEGDVLHHHAPEAYQLVAMNRALHHVWTDRAAVFDNLARDLAPGGVAVIWEPRWPDDTSSLRAPALRGMAFQNLSEHVQGNQFLRPEEVMDGLRDVGLEPSCTMLAEGREMVVVGRKG